jgi:hypothetical protein
MLHTSPTLARTVIPQHYLRFNVADSSYVSLFRAGLLVGLTLLGFAATALVLHFAFFPDAMYLYSEQRSEKLKLLEQFNKKYNTAFFGSSRVENGINPHLFDSALISRNYAIHSINLGILGGSQTEQHSLAGIFMRSLPADCRPDNCLLLFEYNAGLNLQPENLFNPRVIDLYTPSIVKFALNFSSATGTSVGQRLGRDGYALFAGGLNLVNLGMLSSMIFRPPLSQKLLSSYTQNDNRGMFSEPPAPRDTLMVRQAFSGYREVFAKSNTVKPVQPGAYRLLQDTLATSPARHIRFIYFVTPTLEALKKAETTPCSIDGPDGPVPIFNFARADRYPELFRSELWRDPGHLNSHGAAVLSTLLGNAVSDWLQDAHQANCEDQIAIR